MNLLDNFYIDGDNRIQLNTHKLVIRDYKTLEREEYDDNTYYVNDEGYIEKTVNYIPKHQLVELIEDEELDTSAYSWMAGIKLRSDNHWKEIEEIAACGSYAAYETTLPETQDEFNMDIEYRVSKMELGI